MKKLHYIFIVCMVFLMQENALRAQWINTHGPSSIVTVFAVSGNNLFAGTNYGGVFLSTNNGASWSAVNTGLPNNTRVYALAVSGTNIFAGTDNGGVFLSTNNGTSWTAVNNGLTLTSVSALAVSGTNIFAGTLGDGIFLSTNNGTSWTQLTNGVPSFAASVSALAVWGTNLFAAFHPSGLYLSTNNGTSWNLLINAPAVVEDFAFSGANIFVLTTVGLYLSTNNGTSWNLIDSVFERQAKYARALAVSGTNLFDGTYYGVFLTTNKGASWTDVNSTNFLNYRIYALAVLGTNLFAATDYSVWRRPLSEMITGIEDGKNNTPATFSLFQNYPNPFNPSTMISYELPGRSFVTLKVYDLLGKEVKTLVNEYQEAGWYNVQFSIGIEQWSSGIYFYKIQAGEFIQIKKMILIK